MARHGDRSGFHHRADSSPACGDDHRQYQYRRSLWVYEYLHDLGVRWYSPGEVWRSTSTTGWGCDVLDWPGNIAVNFDGWNFVALALRETKLLNDHSPGPVIEQWATDGSGDKKLTLPLELNGLIVELNRKPLQLTEFKDAPSRIRIKDAGGVYE